MSEDKFVLADADDLVYLPNGKMNAPFILANAHLLLKSGDPEQAATLFRLLKNHEKLAHCAHYGLGQCFLRLKQPEYALAAFEHALSLSRQAYIAIALLEVLLEFEEFERVEKQAFDYAQEFAQDISAVSKIRSIYTRTR